MPVNPAAHYRPESAPDDFLIERWQRERDERARDALVERHLPLARRIAQRYRRAHEPPDDLIQVAALGLVKAIERYDASRGTTLAGFAVPTIVGELKRHFRDRGWSVRMPRELQELALRVERTGEELARTLARSPTVREVAEALSVTSEAVLEAREAVMAQAAVPIDEPRSEGTPPPADLLAGEDPEFEAIETRATLGALMAELSERDRELLRLRFVEDLTQTEIGDRLGVSQMHVSRLLSRALARLRAASAEET